MPKILGTETLHLSLIRSITSFQVTVNTPAGDFMDVQPIIERRDETTDALVETVPADPFRFSEAEMRAILDSSPKILEELPDYDTMKIGLAKLMHAMIDARGA